MLYVSISYGYSSGFSSPESWFKRTAGYAGLFEHLAKNNRVISIKQIDYEGDAIYNGVEYRFVNLHREKTHFSFKLNKLIKQLKPDVVIIQGLHNPVQVMLLHAILPQYTRIIAHHHAEKPMPGIKKYVQQLADRFIDAYLFASESLGLDWVRKGIISAAKIHEVMEVSSGFVPMDKAAARQKTGVKGSPAFLWVGRLNDNKDPLTVVRAFLKYRELKPRARLYMIYHTDELLQRLQALISGEQAEDAVILTGHVPHADLLHWFNSADFFISGSHYEGSGTALCEAMSCGCVPVVTNIPSFQTITGDGKCGVLYQAGNEAALLSALLNLEDIDIEGKRLLCLDHFADKLSFAAIAARIEWIAGDL